MISAPRAAQGPDRADATETQGITDTLNNALAAGTREAFTALLAAEVHWGGKDRGGDRECNDRDQAGDFYAGLLTAGVSVRITDLAPDLIDGKTGDGGARGFRAVAHVSSPDPGDPRQLLVRLILRDGLIADICVLDKPPSIEVLYSDGRPNHETFLPHLKALLAEHHITAQVTLIRISDHDDAQAHRFLGSSTVRVTVTTSIAQFSDWNPLTRGTTATTTIMRCSAGSIRTLRAPAAPHPTNGSSTRSLGRPHLPEPPSVGRGMA
jgi:hypothetical protein